MAVSADSEAQVLWEVHTTRNVQLLLDISRLGPRPSRPSLFQEASCDGHRFHCQVQVAASNGAHTRRPPIPDSLRQIARNGMGV